MIKKINSRTGKVLAYCFVQLALFVAIVVLIDFGIGNLLQHFYFTMKRGTQYRTTYAIEKTTADIIIFGSSRAVHQYDPLIFEERLKLSCYNAGRDGEESTLYHYAVLKGITKRYTPKIVILDLMNGELGNQLYSYDRLASLSPYYHTHPELRSIIDLRSKHETLRKISSIYPFNSLIISIFTNNLNARKEKNPDIQGYLPIQSTKIITKALSTYDKTEQYDLDSIKISVLKLFIGECNQKKIKLFIICSPYYEKETGTDYSIVNIEKIAASKNIDFFNFGQDSFYLKRPELFCDVLHLNKNGATIFSNTVAEKIMLADKSRTTLQH